ncbi:MAG: DUF4595 domain-containing protein [Paludibacteraceae bacterium]|nr:DUF4595 domain-containing protein [Paludibacteraceae bacterium]
MKKFLCFFGIFALIAGFVTSCGDDDDDDDGNGTPGGKTVSQKKLKKLVDGNESWEYVYDKDGRCTSYTEFDHNQPVEKINYKYESNKIIEESCLLDGSVRCTTTILFNSNGYIESETTENGGSSDNTVYTYDNQGHLISENYTDEESDETRVTTYTWENGNVTKVEVKEIYEGEESEYVMYYEYTNDNYTSAIENKVGFNVLQIEDGFISPYYLGTLGASLKNLPVAIKYEGEERNDVQTLTWTFDGDGYPVKVVSKNVFDVDTLEFVWE